MSKLVQRVIIYGGKGALGSICVTHFKSKGWWVASIDLTANDEADFNILVTNTDSLPEQEEKVLKALESELKYSKVDSVLCVAGGWTAGNLNKDLAKNTELMSRQNVWCSVIAATIAAKHLKEGGLLTFTGASVALRETPGMIGYGLSKAAVHHLTKSLAGSNANPPTEADSGLPYQAACVAILPTILDTPMNRTLMPKTDISTWTPLEFVVELLWKWCNDEDRPASGSLLQLVTKDFKTDLIPVEELSITNYINA